MKIALLGATGRTGRLVLAGAKARGHEVIALARNTIDAMTSSDISRFVGVSVGGLDVPGDQKGPRDRFIGALARTLAGPASADRQREYDAWQASGHHWTLIRVPRLIDGESTEAPAVDPHKPPHRTTLRRPSLATLLVDYSTGAQFTGLAPFAADK